MMTLQTARVPVLDPATGRFPAAYEDPQTVADKDAAEAARAAAAGSAGTATTKAGEAAGSAADAAATLAASALKADNLSDLASAVTARTNLGLGDSATRSVGTTAGTVAAGDDTRLSDARTPLAHGHDLDAVTDTATRLALTSAERTKLGNTNGTNSGDQTLPTWATLSGKPAVVAAGADAATARTEIGAGPAMALWMVSTWQYNISCPDTDALDIVGDLDVRLKLSLANWNLALTYSFASKTGTTAGNWSWFLSYGWHGALKLKVSSDGTTWRTFETGESATPSWLNTPDAVGWVRVALDVDNGAGGATASFYESVDGTTWTLIRAVTTAGVASIFSGTAPLAIGSDAANGDGMVGKVYAAEVRNGINGTVVASWNSLGGTQKYRDPLGNIWTVTTATAAVMEA